jgi:hypothetical protein
MSYRAYNTNEYQKYFPGVKAGDSTYWNSQSLSIPVQVFLYLYLMVWWEFKPSTSVSEITFGHLEMGILFVPWRVSSIWCLLYPWRRRIELYYPKT